MKFVDYVSIKIVSGNGGRGASSFRREKYVAKGGPDGGNGGEGGHIIFQATNNLQTLMDLKIKQVYRAKNGLPGGPKNQSGRNGEDLIVKVPCGTLIMNEDKKVIADLTEENQTFLAARGGIGGRGNKSFASSVNKAPRTYQPGRPGETKILALELKLLAKVGLIGLPNAGKSTLLKSLTNASPKIGDYPFTTLYPNLGLLKYIDQEIAIADIPGLVEGASHGQGLGTDFLRHIDRTHILVHVVDISAIPSTDLNNTKTVRDIKEIQKDIDVIINELKQSTIDLSTKRFILALNKCDMTQEEECEQLVKKLSKNKVPTILISGLSRSGLDSLKDCIADEYKKSVHYDHD